MAFLLNNYIMNWYAKSLKLASRNLIEMDSIAITKEVFQRIKQLYYSGNFKRQLINFRPELKNFNVALRELTSDQIQLREKLTVHINVQPIPDALMNDDFQVGGVFQNNNIDLDINVSSRFSELSFERLYSKLFEVIRHEINHFVDYIQKKEVNGYQKHRSINVIDNIKDASNYMLSKVDMTSFIVGILLRAKRWRIPFKQALLEVIREQFFAFAGNYNKNLSPDKLLEIEKIENLIVNKMLEKTQETYPNLKSETFYETKQ